MNAIDRGDRAQKLLNDPMLAEAFEGVRATIMDRIEATPVRDTEDAERLRLMLRALRDTRRNLEIWLKDGKLAALELEEEKSRKSVTGLFR